MMEHAIIAAGPADFADHGDSGALVYDPHNNPVGLLFGGGKNDRQPVQGWTSAISDQDRPDEIAVYFFNPGMSLHGVNFYNPFGAVMESMRATLASAFGDDKFELSFLP